MNSFINKALSASIVFGFVIVMGAFMVFAEAHNSEGIHIPNAEISVYSPITDMLGCEINVNIPLFEFIAHDASRIRTFDMSRVPCEDAFAAHQERINNIIALIGEYGIHNLQDLSALLQTLQAESDYAILQNTCAGQCFTIPVWVIINGVQRPGYRCISCGSVFIPT